MGRSRHDPQFLLAARVAHRLRGSGDYRRVVPTDDQQRRRGDTGQRIRSREVGSAAARHHGADARSEFCGRGERRGGTGARAEVTDRQSCGARLARRSSALRRGGARSAAGCRSVSRNRRPRPRSAGRTAACPERLRAARARRTCCAGCGASCRCRGRRARCHCACGGSASSPCEPHLPGGDLHGGYRRLPRSWPVVAHVIDLVLAHDGLRAPDRALIGVNVRRSAVDRTAPPGAQDSGSGIDFRSEAASVSGAISTGYGSASSSERNRSGSLASFGAGERAHRGERRSRRDRLSGAHHRREQRRPRPIARSRASARRPRCWPSGAFRRNTCLRPGQVALPSERLRRGRPSYSCSL